MKTNYAKCLQVVLTFEGGYVNHPKDPGGATNFGVTQKVYDSYRKRNKKQPQSVRHIDKTEVQAIYKEQYWDAVKGDKLPVGIDLAIFDYAVNSGVSRAVRAVQKVLSMPALLPPPGGVKQDGQLGFNTLASIDAAYASDEEKFITLYCEDRWQFVNKLSTFSTFGKGWKRRIMGTKLGAQENDVGVIDIAIAMARGDSTPKFTVPESEATGKANTEDVAIQSTAEGTASGTAAIGTAGTAAAKAGVGGFIGDGIVRLGELAGFTKEQIEPYVGFSTYLTYAFVALGILGVLGVVAVRIKKQREGTVEG